MTEQENVKVAQDMYAAFGRGDITGMLDTLTEDVEWLAYGPTDIPLYGLRRGRGQVGQFFALVSETIDVEQFEPQEFIAQGDKVVVLFYERGKVKASGGSYELHGVDVLTLRGGKVTSLRGYWDCASLAAAYRGTQTAATAKAS